MSRVNQRQATGRGSSACEQDLCRPSRRGPRFLSTITVTAIAWLCCMMWLSPAPAAPLTIEEGDHICIIGGGVADAMQHTGWLEVMLQSRFPQGQLVIRNLAVDGDEVDPAKRLRSADFGSPDQWLTGAAPIPRPDDVADKSIVRENRFELVGTGADVILAFFGSNEAHAGPEGLGDFKATLASFIDHTLSQRYNGVSAPRLVLFTPIAHEHLGGKDHTKRHYPDGVVHNENIRLFAAAMQEVCREKGVACVDLFQPSLEAYERQPMPLTVDGIHPTAAGDRVIAGIIDEALFGTHPARDEQSLQRLQLAVADKNFHWFNRYRVTDGYSTYGGRAWLRFVDGQTNYEVGQRELEYLDVMTANRDRRIWATAATLDDADAPLPSVDEVGLPELIDVQTNKPGPLEGGKHAFLSGEEAIGKMTVHSGMRVELVADEAMFPELINPVQMAFDTRGRLWVAAWPTYPHWRPDEAMNDKLLILEDTDGDGRTDRVKTFADDLHNPTGFEFWGKGVIVAQGPDVLYLEDTDGDDRCDIKERIIRGLDTADTHHTANSFTFDPAGAVYFQEGTFHHSQPETPWGPPARVANGAVFRYEPRTGKVGLYTSYAFANPHGHAFNHWGDDIVVDGTGAVPYWGSVFSTRLDGMDKHGGAPSVYSQRTRPCPGIEFLSSPHFPEEMQGNLLVGNVIGFQGILRYTFEGPSDPRADAFPVAVEAEPIVSSSDVNFRPADLEVGPDGAIYFTDWQNPIIGHMQHNLRDPSRDRQHGRVYRVVMEDRPLVEVESMTKQSVEQLVSLLADPIDRVRYRAKLELAGRDEDEVVPAVHAWAIGLNAKLPTFEHHRLEGLWMLRHFDQVPVDLLEAVLTSPDARARAAGMRVLAAITDRVPEAHAMVVRGAADPSPRVRLEALRTACELRTPEAVEALAVVEEFPGDRFMAYVKQEAARVLVPAFEAARARGESPAFASAAGWRYLYNSMSNDELTAEPRSLPVYREMLLRAGLDERLRTEAVEQIAEADGRSVVAVVADALRALDTRAGTVDTPTVFDLIRLMLSRPTEQLAELRDDLELLAASATRPIMRRVGYVALMTIDAASGSDSVEQVWQLAVQDPRRLVDLVGALPLVSDAGVRVALAERIVPLLEPATAPQSEEPGSQGRYVRIELPGRSRTLTLAEVEVFAGGTNVARSGRASQSSTSHGGEPARAIDGNSSPAYGAGGQTHTQENSENPWWEVDLGSEQRIERIVIANRGEGSLGNRLNNFTLLVLDGNRDEVFRLEQQPAPSLSTEFELIGEEVRLASAIRRAALAAMVSVPGRETEAFRLIAPYVRTGVDRDAAIAALLTIPREKWPVEEAAELLEPLIESLRAFSTEQRSSDAGLAAWQFAENVSRLLPPGEGAKARAVLADLGVRVVRIGTVYERMAYDKETIAVQAGRPVLFVLENSDAMPHNFVIVRPGEMARLGELAESQAQDPAFAKRSFVPADPDVLAAGTLMQPQASQRLAFEVPTKPGVYPYVCTYPGHWRRMFGAMYVVDDLEAYLADPAAYLAANPLEIKDELLADRKPRTEWTFADLEASVAAIEKGRSFIHGRELFRTASCAACHKLGDEGNDFGPELAKLSADMTALEITRHILDPSLKIDEKYRSNTILTDDGQVFTGLVVEETPTEIALVENPLAKVEPVRIKKSGVDERSQAPVSIMPKGLLDQLTRDEVLDLIAYVAARGNEASHLFSPDGCPHHTDAPPATGSGHNH
jgi:putative heme-binding domain-containing protein